MKKTLIFLIISFLTTSFLYAQQTKQEIDKELQKALEAEQKVSQKKKEKKQAPLFNIELSEPEPSIVTSEKAKENLDISVSNLISAMSAIFPGIIDYDYNAAAKKEDESGKANLMELLPGNFEGAKILLSKTSDFNVNKSDAILTIIKSYDQAIRFLNKGYREISTPKAKISNTDIYQILNQQLDLATKLEATSLEETARFHYSGIYIYNILLETILNTFYSEQNLIKAEIKKELNILHDPSYYIHKKLEEKLSLKLDFIRKDFNNVIDAIKFFIIQNQTNTLLNNQEKTLNYLYDELRNLNIELNIIKTRLKLYNILNKFDIIDNSPLTKKIIRIKDIRIKQSVILDDLKNEILRINNIYNTLSSGDVATALENIWRSSITLEDSFLLLGTYSIIGITNKDFTENGYFHKKFKEISYYRYIKTIIEDCALKWEKDKQRSSFKSLLQNSNIFVDIDQDTKQITMSVKFKDADITSPFLKYLQDYFFEFSAGNNSTTKNVTIKIGSYKNNQLSAVEITKSSPLDKPGFDLGFDLKTQNGKTIISTIINDKIINTEIQSFDLDKQNNIQQTRKVLSVADDNKSFIDTITESIIGDGKILVRTTNIQSKTKTTQTLLYKNSILQS